MLDRESIKDEIRNIGRLTDNTEKTIRLEIINKIIKEFNNYDEHIREYDYTQKRNEIQNKGVIFKDISSEREMIKEKWLKMFTFDVDNEIKKEVLFYHFFWHLFSFNKLKAKQGKEAKLAFDNCHKNQVYTFYQNNDKSYFISNAKNLIADDFDMDDDIYVFDMEFKWTYIKTHEKQCGPYFYYIK